MVRKIDVKRILGTFLVLSLLSAPALAQAPLPSLVPQPGMEPPQTDLSMQGAQQLAPAVPVMPPALGQPGVQIPFPNFRIDVECARQAGGPTAGRVDEFGFRNCRMQEFQAHDVLLANWAAIPVQVILGCMSIARGTGFGSYAVLATCISPQFPLR